MITTTTISTPLGKVTLAASEHGLAGLWFLDQRYFFGKYNMSDAKMDTSSPLFSTVEKWLLDYFAGKNPKITFPLAPVGSEFRQSIWRYLSEIPYGQLSTYGDLAKSYARNKGIATMSAQAVGGAIGHNPISIIIPCHRVVGHNNSLTGYSSGEDNKIALLKLEKSVLTAPKFRDFS